MTIQFTNGMMVEIIGGTWKIDGKIVTVWNAQGRVELEAPIANVQLVTMANLQSAQANLSKEDEEKLEALETFDRMIWDDSTAVTPNVQG